MLAIWPWSARPLLLASANPELAAARGIPVRLVGYVYLLALSLSVALCALTIGSILSHRAPDRAGRGGAARLPPAGRAPPWPPVALGVAATWLGVLLAYDSYAWPPHHQGWPVSFFVVAAGCSRTCSAACRSRARRRARRADPSRGHGEVGATVFSAFMVNAWIVGTIVAVVAGAVGFFVVTRGSAFAAHALPNGSFAGAAGAALIGVNTLIGLAVVCLLRGARDRAARPPWSPRRRDRAGPRDDARARSAVSQPQRRSTRPRSTHCCSERSSGSAPTSWRRRSGWPPLAFVGLAVLYRPLMLSSVLAEVARARGIGEFAIELGFLVVVALTAAMTIPVVGHAARVQRDDRRAGRRALADDTPGRAMALSVAIALATSGRRSRCSYRDQLSGRVLRRARSAPDATWLGDSGARAAGRRRPAAAGRRLRATIESDLTVTAGSETQQHNGSTGPASGCRGRLPPGGAGGS